MASYIRTIPTPEPEVSGDTRIQSYDPIIGHILEQASGWARVHYPATDSFESIWGLAVEAERRATQHRHYMAVRELLPDLLIMVHLHGDSPGAPGYLELNFDREGDEDYRSVCYADPMDGPYKTDDGRTITGQVWYNNGDLADILEFEVCSAERIAAAIVFMWNKYKAVYTYPTTTPECH